MTIEVKAKKKRKKRRRRGEEREGIKGCEGVSYKEREEW